MTPTDPIAEIIANLKESELRKLITYLAGQQKEVRTHLLTKYAHLLEVVSKSQYEQLVRSYLDTCSGGRQGFIPYREAHHLGNQLYTLLDNADSDNPMAVVYLCEAIIFQLAEAFQHADDSSGSMGAAMEAAFHKLYDLAKEETGSSPEVVTYILEYAIREYNKEVYQGWDWDGNLRSLACMAVRNKKEAEQLIKLLEAFIKANLKEEYSEYNIEAAEGLKLDLLTKYSSLGAADAHLNNNLHHSSFRERALEKAMEEKKYKLVRQLAEDGIIQDTKEAPGWVKKWKEWLVRLSKETGDTTSFIKINEELFFDRGNMDHYRKLKEIIPKKEFKNKVDSYIQQFRNRENPKWGPSFNRYVALILEEENRLEELMEEIKKSPSLHLLDHYFDLLGKSFKADFLILYEQLIRHHMDKNTGRSSYVECCKYIDKIVRLGGLEVAKIIVADWRKQYPRRRAMIEELAQYKW